MKNLLKTFFCLTVTACFSSSAYGVDWNSVKGKDIDLFYPGQASWEWILTDHDGAKKFKEGKNCSKCHEGEQKDKDRLGNVIVTGKKLEPTPIAGKEGALTVNAKAAYDNENLYVRLEWKEDKAPTGAKMEPNFESMVALMLDDGTVKEASRAGCWGTCHDDTAGMASSPAGKDLTLYLAQSRAKIDRKGGGENFKPQADLDKLLSGGTFIEYWQAKVNKDKPAKVVDGYILDKRHETSSPIVNAESSFKDGKWTVVLSRKLAPNKTGYKNIVAGKTYAVGFAVHTHHSKGRFHYVSFDKTLVLEKGTADDIVAVKVGAPAAAPAPAPAAPATPVPAAPAPAPAG